MQLTRDLFAIAKFLFLTPAKKQDMKVRLPLTDL